MPLQPAWHHPLLFQVTAKFGEGGMGEVYRVRDTKLDRDVALKVLPQADRGERQLNVKGGAKLDHRGGGTLDHLAAGRSS